MGLDDLEQHRHPENPKDHDIPGIISSFERFGVATAITVCERTGYIAAGHGRLEALQLMKTQGDLAPENVDVKVDVWAAPVQRGWSSKDDEELLAYVIADNRHTELGGWLDNLPQLLKRLAESRGLQGTGFDGADLKALLEGVKQYEGSPASDGSLLTLVDISIDEPTHQVKPGEIYKIHGRHTLLCVDVMSGWKAWSPYLEGDAIFVPYPGPYAAISTRADLAPMVLVQPDPYLAGHILDKFAAMNSEELVVKVTKTRSKS